MSSRRLAFVLPSGSHLISGGNIYNRELLAAARRHRTVDALSVADWEREVAAGEPGTFVVDTLNMSEFLGAVRAPRPDGQRFLLVVHLLPSMDPVRGDHPSLAVERAALPRFDGFLVTSAYTAGQLRQRGQAQPCLTVPPGLPARPRPPLELGPGLRALIVGNLVANKGVLPFIHALAAAVRAGDPLAVDVVGRLDLDADHAAACLRAARDAGLTAEDPGSDRGLLRFCGPASYEAMDGHYRRSSLFLSPSLMETFGMALQEARAFGLPILACDAGNSAAHVEEGVNGHLYRSIPDLVEGLMELVRSPEQLRGLFASAQAARTGGDYTWDVAACDFLRQLDEFERAGAPDGAPG